MMKSDNLTDSKCHLGSGSMKKTTRFLRRKEILEIIGVSNVTLWRWIDKGAFPKSYQLGENSVGWKDNEVNEWIENRTAI